MDRTLLVQRARRTPRGASRLPRRARLVPRVDNRWWWVAIGSLSMASLVPRWAESQGLRAQPVMISLTAVAPPKGRTGGALVRGASITGVQVRSPLPTSGDTPLEVRLESALGTVGKLYVRDVSARLTPVALAWIAVGSGAETVFRAIASSPGKRPTGTWRVRFRRTRDDSGQAEAVADVVVDAGR